MRFNAYNFSIETKKSLGLELKKLIYDCEFNSERCDFENDFRWIYNLDYGNCFQFNFGFNKDNNQTQKKFSFRAGHKFGLKLKIYVGSSVNSTEEGVGLRIMIHNSSLDPSFENGINVATGFETNIAVETIFINRQESPYSDCISNLENIKSDLKDFIIKSNKSYRRVDCLNLCFQRYVIKECGCYYPGFDSFYSKRQCASIQDIVNFGEVFKNFWKLDLLNLCEPECPLECDSVDYKYLISSSSFPSQSYMENLIRIFPSNFTSKLNRENHLALNIFFNTLSYTRFKEDIKTSPLDLISNLGGILGLFTGASFLSFFEIFEILFYLLISYFEKPQISDTIKNS